jgi:lysozyme
VVKRITVAALSLTALGFVGILGYEGYSGETIIPIPGDVPTIGFGTTEGVKHGDTITPPQAVKRALKDVQKFEGAIKQCVKVPLHQYEYDVFVSLSYNIGTGAFCSSTLVRKLNEQDYSGACAEISRWVYANGKKIQGLINRRERERAMCEGK